MEDCGGPDDAVTTGEAIEADEDDLDLLGRFEGPCWTSTAKPRDCDIAEFGSDSAFRFMPVWMTGLWGGFGGGDSGFWADVEVAVWTGCGDG